MGRLVASIVCAADLTPGDRVVSVGSSRGWHPWAARVVKADVVPGGDDRPGAVRLVVEFPPTRGLQEFVFDPATRVELGGA